jgi:LemA protein
MGPEILAMTTDPILPAIGFALGGPLVGSLLLRSLSRQDHDTWVMARAPALPIRTLAVGDDAWVRGIVDAECPLVCPVFDVACVSYSYQREREHTWTTTDKDGKTTHHSEWRTERSESRAVDFVVDDGDRIVVRKKHVDNEAGVGLRTIYETSSLRHSATVIELGAKISVLAVKQDDGSFAAEREVPCLLTRRTRDERVRGSARSEGWLFFFACFFAFAGGAGAAAFWIAQTTWGSPSLAQWSLCVPAGLLTLLPIWWVGSFNQLVRLRQQVGAAFRQVDVDLSVRAALVPNLVEVVRSYAAHERDLLERLSAIRAGRDPKAAAAAEREASAAARSVLLLHEHAPQLRADALYRDLHDRLWAVEEKLAHTRQLYNDIVTEWNNRITMFPQGLVAGLMKCRSAPMFTGEDEPVPPRLTD